MNRDSRRSFRTLLAAQTMLVAGVLLAVFGAAAWWYVRGQLARNVDLRIADPARRLWAQLTPRTTEREFRTAVRQVFGEIDTLPPTTAVLAMAHGERGAILFSSSAVLAKETVFASLLPPPDPNADFQEDIGRRGRQRGPAFEPGGPPGGPGGGGPPRPLMPEQRAPLFFTAKTAAGEWRFGAFSNPHYTVFVGLALREYYAELRQAAWWAAAAGVAGLALAGLGAWWTSGRAMRPLDRVVATAQRLNASALDQRIPLASHDTREFAELITVLNRMTDRLETSFQQAARFTADAAHELKTPLAVMQATLHDALRRDPADGVAPDELEALARECARLKSITQSLLLLSQADAGKLPLARENYDLSADLSRLVEDAEALCAQTGLRCEHALAPGLHIAADRALMRQVFQNLLSNAVKYNRPGGLVQLALTAAGGQVEFTIANTGPGIPAAAQPRLFERFFRADAARTTEGAGLGLNIAHELARANGAEFRLLESTAALTRFVVRIPIAVALVERA